jgi:hypothetical protein
MKTPAQLVKHMFTNAKEIIESGREAIPMLVLQHGDKLTFVGIPWRNHCEKEFAIAAIRHLLAKDAGITAYAMVSEAWQSTTDGPDPEFKVQPRHDPKRREVVIVTGFDRGGESAFRVAEIKTLPDKVRRVMLPDDKDYEAMAGQMINFFAPEETVN